MWWPGGCRTLYRRSIRTSRYTYCLHNTETRESRRRRRKSETRLIAMIISDATASDPLVIDVSEFPTF